MRNQETKKMFKCETCKATFTRKDKQVSHSKRCFKCSYCGQKLGNAEELELHQDVCEGVPSYKCKTCHKGFTRKNNMRVHEIKCRKSHPRVISEEQEQINRKKQRERAHLKRKVMEEQEEMNKRRKRTQPKEPPEWKCARCKMTFNTDSNFARHIYTEHLKTDARNTDDDNAKIEELIRNRSYIIAPHKRGPVLSVYNFPVYGDSVLDEELIRSQLEEIYREASHSFKINVSMGLLLYNKETKKYRVFKSVENSMCLRRGGKRDEECPQKIANRKDLEECIKHVLNIDIPDYSAINRPNTEWELVSIPNIKYYVYKTDFPLGASIDIPDWLKNIDSIITLDANRDTGVKYTDNKCLYRCLAYHQLKSEREGKVKNIERRTKEIEKQWLQFKEKMTEKTAKKEDGVQYSDIAEFEECFNININIYELQQHSTTTSDPHHNKSCKTTEVKGHFYKSPSTYPYTMNLNIYIPDNSSPEPEPEPTVRKRTDQLSPPPEPGSSSHDNSSIEPAVRKRTEQPDNRSPHQRLTKGHLSYITNFNAYADTWTCGTCSSSFHRRDHCQNHELNCKGGTKDKYPGGFYGLKASIWDDLASIGIVVAESDRFYEKFVCYDYESMLVPTTDSTSTEDKLQWQAVHIPVSVSIASNVENYSQPKCIVERNSPELLVSKMVDYLMEIQEECQVWADEKWHCVFESLATKSSLAETKMEKDHIHEVHQKFKKYCSQMPVLGFNSGKYDINLVRTELLKYLHHHSNKNMKVIKQGSVYSSINTSELIFLDVIKYQSPSVDLAKFLASEGVSEQKGYFPYEWFDCSEKLDYPSLPPPETFYSSMKEKNVLGVTDDEIQKNYQLCQQAWREKGMIKFENFLEWYNNLDVGPMVEAVENMLDFYTSKKIDLFKTTIGIPGVGRELLFRSGFDYPNFNGFALLDEANKDLAETIENNIVGGPSIIFTRYHHKDETWIRSTAEVSTAEEVSREEASIVAAAEDRSGLKMCDEIVGFDANALYLWALSQDQPTGEFIRWHKMGQEDRFSPRTLKTGPNASQASLDWLNHYAGIHKVKVQHKLNSGKEHRIGPYTVDGWIPQSQTALEFHGCWYHGCDCIVRTEKNKEWLEERKRKTEEKMNYLRRHIPHVIEMYECKWEATRTSQKRNLPRSLSFQQLINRVQDNSFFGMLEVDIEVPDELKEKFSEMAPLFVTCDIPFEEFGTIMQQYLEERNLPKNPRRQLVAGLKAQQILLATPLLKWYLDHGLMITRIYQGVQFKPQACFHSFTTQITDLRREAVKDESKLPIANKMKLTGNSAYGGVLMNKVKHHNLQYCQDNKKLATLVNNNKFKRLEDLGINLHEVMMGKSTLNHDIPKQIGFFVLCNAK